MIAEIGDAASNGKVDAVRKLVQADAMLLTSRDANGWTPLLIASYYDKAEIVDLLISRGANVNEQDEDQYHATALHWAADRGRTGLIFKLVSSGANVHIQDADQYTALHRACKSEHPLTVFALLLVGADPRKSTIEGEMPGDLTSSSMIHLILKMAERICWSWRRRQQVVAAAGGGAVAAARAGKAGRRRRWRGMTKWGAHDRPYQQLDHSPEYSSSSSSSTSTMSSGEWDYDDVDDDEEASGPHVDEPFIDGEGRRWPHRIVI